MKAMEGISSRLEVTEISDQAKERKGRAFFAIFGDGRSWSVDDEEKQEREDKEDGQKHAVNEQKGGQRGRQRIVKEECHLNKEVASSGSVLARWFVSHTEIAANNFEIQREGNSGKQLRPTTIGRSPLSS